MLVFIGSVAPASILSIYLVVKRVNIKKQKIEKAKEAVEQETGIQVPDDVIKKIVKKQTEETIEDKLLELEQKQRVKELKKANKGSLKLKKRIFLVFHRKAGMSPEIHELGKAHSYDRFGLDGKDDQVIIYYYPRHNSVFLRGLQVIIGLFGRGKHRLQVPFGTIISGLDVMIINADHIKSIAPNTYQVVPPEEIKVDIDLYTAYRDRYEVVVNLLNQVLEDLNKPFKKVLAYRGGGIIHPGYPARYGYEGEEEFVPFENESASLETIDNTWRRLKERKKGLGGD